MDCVVAPDCRSLQIRVPVWPTAAEPTVQTCAAPPGCARDVFEARARESPETTVTKASERMNGMSNPPVRRPRARRHSKRPPLLRAMRSPVTRIRGNSTGARRPRSVWLCDAVGKNRNAGAAKSASGAWRGTAVLGTTFAVRQAAGRAERRRHDLEQHDVFQKQTRAERQARAPRRVVPSRRHRPVAEPWL